MKTRDIKPYRNIIEQCPIFQGVSSKIIDEIIKDDDTEIIEAQPGDMLDGNYMYVILSGSVIIEKTASDGRFVTMLMAEAPSPINVATAFSNNENESRFPVKEEGIFLKVSGERLKEEFAKGGQFTFNVAEFLTDRIAFLNKKIISLAGYSATSRLTMYLHENSEGNIVTIPMSLSAFADYLGVGRASLYRTLDSMEESGQIRRRGRKIEILKALSIN